ncbi:MAG: hypothetical protein NDJ90_06785 [Oligoflexia bacterium]|nr:hypothetical protein [Oligoflexia bacterium]
MQRIRPVREEDMRQGLGRTLAVFWLWLVAALAAGLGVLAQDRGGGGPIGTAPAPLSDYTAAVVGYVLLVGFLVSLLLIGGILIVNLGLMSKRPEDRRGGRTPSDVGLLRGNTWVQEEPDRTAKLPAEEDEEALRREAERKERFFKAGRFGRFRRRPPAA